MVIIAVYMLEGVSMGVLMIFHLKNFSQGSLLSSQDNEERPYASIFLGEYHRFDTEEVDAESLAYRSSYTLEDSEHRDTVTKDGQAPILINASTTTLNLSKVGNEASIV